MKPLKLSLALFAQSFKKVAFRELYLESLNAQEEAKQIFGVEVPFILDANKKLDRNNCLVSRIEKLAEYDWHCDANRIFYKRIKILCQKYDVDFNSVIYFCLCHETGHAKEQRLFEEIGFFPNTIRRLPEGVPIKIESTNYVLTSRGFYDIFSCGICDFSINEELAKHNIKNQLAKKMFFDTTGLQPVNSHTEEEWHKFVLDCLLRLPLVLTVYEHGELNESERRTLKESQEEVIGDKWEKTLLKLKSTEFFNPKSKIDVILELLENILGIPAFLGINQKREILFNRYSTLPKFWNKEGYRVMYL
jgi:hypothetical protein